MDPSPGTCDTVSSDCVKSRKIRSTATRESLSPLTCNNHLCYGCNESLDTSPMIASVLGHHKWHINCLRCCECDDELSQEPSCFIKNGRVYCRIDYAKLISKSVRCAKCFRSISPSDWVRKAATSVYHLACFACDLCQRQLSTGEQFTIDSVESKLICKLHFGGNKEIGDSHDSSSNDSMSSSSMKPSKTKRVRTTFTEEQLQVLQANFQIDSNPDGQDLERIAGLTGLSKRVTQVWFQNSRARQKKHLNKNRSINGSSSSSSSFASITVTTASHSTQRSTGHMSSSCSSPSSSPLSSSSSTAVNCSSKFLNRINSRSVTMNKLTNAATSTALDAIYPAHGIATRHSLDDGIAFHGGLLPLTAARTPRSTDACHLTNADESETCDSISNLITNNNSWSLMTMMSNSNECESIEGEIASETNSF